MSAARHALFPGTFDPPTLGHLALLRRSLALFEKVTVAVAAHPTKQHLFSLEERLELLRESAVQDPTIGADALESGAVQFVHLPGLVIEGCQQLGCEAIVRGVRSGTDLDYEVVLARNNRALLPSIDTVILVPDPEFAHLTSSIVRQVAAMGGDASGMVPGPVARALTERFGS
jgi:pantetheine-phosphate adenylyltransferase